MKNVTIYTSSSCSYCHAAKDYFNENNIPYTEKNVSEDPEARKNFNPKENHGCSSDFYRRWSSCRFWQRKNKWITRNLTKKVTVAKSAVTFLYLELRTSHIL